MGGMVGVVGVVGERAPHPQPRSAPPAEVCAPGFRIFVK